MSQETEQWLNQNILVGFTSKRGNAWHYRSSAQGAESNHYEEAIPQEDVTRRLFSWDFLEGDVSSTVVHADGVTVVEAPDRKAIIRPDGAIPGMDAGVLGIFKTGYQVHPYQEWLLDNVSSILDDSELQVASAGLLKGGAVAFVQVEMPENIETPEGFAFRPFLTAATSVDGSLSSTYQTGVTAVVCDNTLSAALAEKESANRIKVRHSRNSLGRVSDVRDALQIVYSTADAFAAQVAELSAQTVSDREWAAFLDAHVPVPPVKAGARGTRSNTMANNKRDELQTLWDNDNRVSPWKNTAFGVVQAVNTHAQHIAGVKGATRADRNALASIEGRFQALDADTLQTLRKVLAFSS
jgi:phage/plasmid-like protein (TIGR03299 family)